MYRWGAMKILQYILLSQVFLCFEYQDLWFDSPKKSHNLLLPFIKLLIPITWIIQTVKNEEFIKKFKVLINKHTNALKTNITKLNFTCDTLYHSPFFTSFIMGVNLNSNWLPCAQYGLELGVMCTMWTWT
jgi:hypothetical protein